jgi:hypothetical protein
LSAGFAPEGATLLFHWLFAKARLSLLPHWAMLNAGYLYLEVRCLGCDTHQTVALNIVRRPKATPVHELERYMRCKDCSQVRRYPFKRSHLVALRPTKISTLDPPSTWWPGERRRHLLILTGLARFLVGVPHGTLDCRKGAKDVQKAKGRSRL